MIRLGKAGARERLEFGGGAFIVYRTATTIDHEAGTQAARAFFRAVRAGKDSLESFGLAATPIAAIDLDDALAFGVSEVVSLTEIALRCVSEWGGIGDEAGAALPLNRANLCALLQDARYFQAVRDALLAPLHMLAAEGNASAPSPNGEAAGAPTIAETAAPPASPAPADAAA
jgi:hypothetical protein